MVNKNNKQNPFKHLVDLAQPRLGSMAVYATDEFFAAKERLIDPAPPIFVADKYDDNGKWMDGWESRRKRGSGHDFCVVRLGVPGQIKGFDIDTSHFTGNYPPAASIDGCISNRESPDKDMRWEEILARVELRGDSHHFHSIDSETHFTHVRLHIYPDGGVARLRVYGVITPDWSKYGADEIVDLVALENGGQAVSCSDEHYGSIHNLNAPGRGVNMGDGWETARRRGPGHDWAMLKLGQAGEIKRVAIDTVHFKGNYPDRVSIQAAYVTGNGVEELLEQSDSWQTLMPEVKLDPDKQHVFTHEVQGLGAVTHVRLNIFPDGGVSRIRLFGHISP